MGPQQMALTCRSCLCRNFLVRYERPIFALTAFLSDQERRYKLYFNGFRKQNGFLTQNLEALVGQLWYFEEILNGNDNVEQLWPDFKCSQS